MGDNPAKDPYEEPPNYRPPRSAEELLRRYQAGERYFVDIEIPEMSDLSGIILADSNFESGELGSIDFRGADLRHVSFRGCYVKCSDFRGANLEGAIFAGASVESTLFEGANLASVTFAGATAYGYTLKDGDVP